MKQTILTAAMAALMILSAQAQFTPGKLAVLQAGDGGTARGAKSPSDFANKQNPVFIDQFEPTVFNTNGPSFQVAIPTNGASALWVNGNAGTEGNLTRAADRSVLVFSGYNGDILSIAGTPSQVAYDRGIGVINAAGNHHLAYRGGAWYGISTGKTNPRGVATDGTNQFWGCGNGYGSIYYDANSGADPVQFQNITTTSAVKVRNNAVYTTVIGKESVNLYPAGIYSFVDFYNGPVPYPNAASYLHLEMPVVSPYTNCIGFDIDPSGTIAYVADTSLGIQKYIKSGGTWNLACNFYIPGYLDAVNYSRFLTNNTSAAVQVGCFGLTVDWTGPAPVIFATTSDAAWVGNPYYGNRVIRIDDTNAVTTGATITNTVTTIAIAPVTNMVYKCVDLTPDLRPLITAKPASWSAAANDNVSFTVAAQSTSTISYQWLANGTNLPGQVGATLALNAVTIALNGTPYQCIVSNSYGAVTSAPPAILTVTALPVAPSLGAAQNLSDQVGANILITANASGTDPKTYQWYLGGDPLSDTGDFGGTTTATLHISNAQKPADEGDYAVVVNNITANAASNRVATLSLVYPKPVFSEQPGSTTTFVGANVGFASAGYGNSLSYQWYTGPASGPVAMLTDGSGKYTGSGTDSLTVNNTQASDATNYFVVLTATPGGSVTSSPAALAVVAAPAHSFVPYASLGQVYTQSFDALPIPNSFTYNTANPQPMTVVTNVAFPTKTVNSAYSLANPYDFAYPVIASGFVGGLGLAGKMDGWYGWAGTQTKFGASVGDQSTGGQISEGGAYTGTPVALNVTNRALGLLATSTTGPTAFGVKLVNQTSKTLYSISLSYTGELWRQQARAQTLAFGYAIDATATNLLSTNVTAWVPSLNVSFATNSGGLLVLDGTQSSNQVNLAVTSLPIAPWPAGAALWLVWLAADSQGGAQGIAIDNLRFAASVSGPSLGIQRSGSDFLLSWPQSAAGYSLQGNGLVSQPGGWSAVTQAVIPTNGLNTVTMPGTNAPQYFRLAQ